MNNANPRLLLVDDDVSLAAMLHEFLELHGFRVDVLHEGEPVLARLDADPPDLVILDVMLPDTSGFDVLRRLRENHSVPVIMLTARGEESDRIFGLMGGADDYLPKPFNPLELTVRIQAVLKRTAGDAPTEAMDTLIVGPLKLDLKRRTMSVDTTPVQLTAAEMRVLEQLMRSPGEVLSRSRLTQTALDRPIEAYDRSIDTLISKIRRKLSAAGIADPCIRGLRGHGYVLDDVIGSDNE
jgi:two-component system OmpR family response regulator